MNSFFNSQFIAFQFGCYLVDIIITKYNIYMKDGLDL